MASKLEELVNEVQSLASSTNNDAAILEQMSLRCRQDASQLQSVLSGSQNPRAQEVIILLVRCSELCFRAAQSCRAAANIGLSWASYAAGRSFIGTNSSYQMNNSPNATITRGEGQSAPLSFNELQLIAKRINPGYDQTPGNPRRKNCGSCALSLFRTLNGAPAVAGEKSLSLAEMERATGMKQIPMSSKDIQDRLIAMGPGSHTIVGIDRKGWSGHWFNAYYDGERVVAVDGQDGSISGWPPDYGTPAYPVTLWDAAF